jgi:hypothetical protein
MKVLQQGIYTIVTAAPGGVHNSFYTSIGGRFYFEFAPQDTVFPYCTYHIIHDTYDYTFTDNMEDMIIQFSIFSSTSSSSEVMDIFEYLKTLFDWKDGSLSVTGYRTVRVERLFATTDWVSEESLWFQVVQYRILLIKT